MRSSSRLRHRKPYIQVYFTEWYMVYYFRIYLLDVFKPFVVIDLRDVRFISDALGISYQLQVDKHT